MALAAAAAAGFVWPKASVELRVCKLAQQLLALPVTALEQPSCSLTTTTSPPLLPPSSCQQDGLRYGGLARKQLPDMRAMCAWLACKQGFCKRGFVPPACVASRCHGCPLLRCLTCHPLRACLLPLAGKFFLVQFPQFSTLLLPLEPLIRLCECLSSLSSQAVARAAACLAGQGCL